MTQYYQIQASPSIIRHATVLFNATLRDILIELLQNSRRAGASHVKINLKTRNENTFLVFEDDGNGIFHEGVNITLGDSNWDEAIQNREYPAGMGLFSLAVRGCTIEANHKFIALQPEHFNGEELVEIISSQYNDGTRITIPLEKSELVTIESLITELACYYTLPVLWNGQEMPQKDFLEGALFIEEWHGLQIGVFQYYQKPDINFYGLLLSHYGLPSIENCLPQERFRRELQVKINVLDAPELRLVLPSRKEVVYNHFFEQLEDHCKTVIYRYLAQHGEHCLSFNHYTEAAQRGISLPPAKPQLIQYSPRIGDEDNRRSFPEMYPLQQDKKYLIVDREEEAPMEQIFARSFQKAYPNSVLMRRNDEMKGYQWYDELPRITDINIKVHFEEGSYLIYEVPDDMLQNPVTAVNVMLEITENEQVEKVTIPSDIGFWCGETVYYELSAVDFFVPQDSKITADELSDLLFQSYFRFADESCADSYETQFNEFEDEADYTAVHTLQTGQEATEQRIKMYLERNLIWMIPHEQKVIITVDNRNIDVKFS